MQLVTPSVVMMAVSMLMMSCKMNFHVFTLAILSNAKMQNANLHLVFLRLSKAALAQGTALLHRLSRKHAAECEQEEENVEV